MAEDIARPICKCHGEPMHRNGRSKRSGFRCSVRKCERERNRHWNEGGRETRQKRYTQRKKEGLCTRCGEPSLTSSVCWGCLNDQAERDALRI